jgi:2-polyprenyl-3-methyl-5-hydroxy-6-metoxy-1,4-benzoquinol methylase
MINHAPSPGSGPGAASAEARCWCGSTQFQPAPHDSYLVCSQCQTAHLRQMVSPKAEVVQDDASSLYGSDYWEAHMAELGFPSIEQRSRMDLAERCNYWLKFLLKYRLPPARVLEIGCAHGGFVKMLNLAGYTAMGMEMSPVVIDKACRRFEVEVVQGPIEAVNGNLPKFDIIAMFDVLEHFPDPNESLARIVEHMQPGGLLMVQTPEHRPGLPAGWRNYKPPEHTFLFGRSSVARLLHGAGLHHCTFEPALFEGDMFFIASDQPVTPVPDQEIGKQLLATPNGRIVLALQDQYWATRDLAWRMLNEPLSDRFGVRRLAWQLLRAMARWPGQRFGRRALAAAANAPKPAPCGSPTDPNPNPVSAR